MRFGFVVPYADSRDFADLAVVGEESGWDAVFTWEALFGVDAWASMAAAAMVTETIKLGTLVTPVPRVKPWDLATKVGTLDRLSGGRAILGAGLGALHDGWVAYEPDEGRRTRAQKLDEGLAVYAGLMRGQPFEFAGQHYQAKPNDFMLPDPPVQQPWPPVWVVGAHVLGKEAQPSLERAARWEGLIPQVIGDEGRANADSPDELAEITRRVREFRENAGLPWDGYDVIWAADSWGDARQAHPGDIGVWAAAGATWWIESWWSLPRGPEGLAEVRRRITQGPPG